MDDITTYPLQDISDPMAADSRQLKPNALAAMPQAKNFAENATTQMRIT